MSESAGAYRVGGYRPGAGRKSRWNGETKMIRLPAKYEAEIVEFAKLLDSTEPGEVSIAASSVSRSRLDEEITAVLFSIPPSQRRSANQLFKKLLKRLEGQ